MPTPVTTSKSTARLQNPSIGRSSHEKVNYAKVKPMTFSRDIVSNLWFGRLKRPTRAAIRRLMPEHESTILFGPLRGKTFRATRYVRLGIYERAIEELLLKHLKPGQVFFDIGANVGYFSLLAAQLSGPDGHIYSIDPAPNNVNAIRYNLDVNGIINYTLIEKAVSDKTGYAELALLDGTRARLNTKESSGSTITVQTTTLDDLYNYYIQPDVIKIDVEGAEALVLEGATELLNNVQELKIIIEVHDEANDNRVQAILREAKYDIQAVSALNKRRSGKYPHHIIAVRQIAENV